MTEPPHRLPHSGMRVPHVEFRVSSLSQRRTRHGIAYEAKLRRGKKVIGTIENEGYGGMTDFFPSQVRAHPDFVGREALEAFAEQCTEDDGNPVGYEACLEYLISEYEIPRAVTKAARTGMALLRLMEFIYDDGDEPIGAPMINRTIEVPAEWNTADRIRRLGAALLAGTDAPPPGTWWQAWQDDLWRDVTARPEGTSPHFWN